MGIVDFSASKASLVESLRTQWYEEKRRLPENLDEEVQAIWNILSVEERALLQKGDIKNFSSFIQQLLIGTFDGTKEMYFNTRDGYEPRQVEKQILAIKEKLATLGSDFIYSFRVYNNDETLVISLKALPNED